MTLNMFVLTFKIYTFTKHRFKRIVDQNSCPTSLISHASTAGNDNAELLRISAENNVDAAS